MELFSASKTSILIHTSLLFQISVKVFDFVFGIFILGHCICICACVSTQIHACAQLKVNHFEKNFFESHFLCHARGCM